MSNETSQQENVRWVAAAGAVALLLVAGVAWYLLRPDKVTDVRDMRTLVERLDGLQNQIDVRQRAIAESVRDFNATHPNDRIEIESAIQLKDLQQQILQRMVHAERDVSYQGLLDEIGRQGGEISRLNNEIAAIRSRLPEPIEVREGDTHYGLSLKYLNENRGLPQEEAEAILNEFAMVEDLVSGFQVWMIYDKTSDLFGSFVTQGSAPISPRRAQTRSKRALFAKIERAEELAGVLSSQKLGLEKEVDRMELVASDLQAHLNVVQWERDRAQRLAEARERERQAVERRHNSFFYAVGKFDEFKKNGVVKGGRIVPANEDLFVNSVDLRSEKMLSFSAEDAGFRRIGSVKIVPSTLKNRKHYKINYSTDRQNATIEIVDKDAFIRERRVLFGLKN